MKRIALRYILFISAFWPIGLSNAYSQNVPQGFNYQTTVRNNSGAITSNQSVGIRFSFYSNSPTGTLVWQENHFLTTDNYGHVKTIIGTGANTGAGVLSAFDQINWSTVIYYLKVSLDSSGGTSFTDMGTSQLFSVPYSLYSLKTNLINNLALGELNDVDTTANAIGRLLKWNGTYWVPAIDNFSDTVLYAMNAGYSSTSDTATYVFGISSSDTTLFAYQSDSSIYSNTSGTSVNTNSSVYSDTAMYVLSSPANAWTINGNVGDVTNYFGTNDLSNINFISNNSTRATLQSNGRFSINNSLSNSNLALLGNDGILLTGALSSTVNTISGAGTKMLCFPARGAFRAGYVDSNQWDTTNIGNYSIATGHNNKVRNWSFSSGSENEAIDCSITFGRKNQALGLGIYPEGGCVAIGDSNVSTFRRTVTLGKNNIASNSASVAIGYGNVASGNTSTAIGAFCTSAGTRSVAIGFHASSLFTGSFAFADASSSTPVATTINHQFKVRASGGVVFYTDTLNTMGVTLNSGSGSWAVISDRNKKENFSGIDYESVLANINKLKIKTWNYRSQPKSIRHIGPMAQDFYSLFKFGENNVTITTGDMDGVILAGIKGLNNRMNKLNTIDQVEMLKLQIEQMDNSDELNNRLDAIEAAINKK